jgi:ligand-binding sensor domain-containing protein
MASTVIYRESQGQSLTMVVGHTLSRTFEFISSGKAVSVPVARLYQDRQGNLWIGTEGDGLYRLQSQPIHVISKEQGLTDRDEYAVYQDHSGEVWVGAWHVGVNRFADGKITNYSMADGLPGTHVTAILEERDGRVWVAAHEGGGPFETRHQPGAGTKRRGTCSARNRAQLSRLHGQPAHPCGGASAA